MTDLWEGGQGWTDPDEWPPRTNWAVQMQLRPGKLEKKTSRQAAMVERERNRTPSYGPQPWGRSVRCGHCDTRAFLKLRDWRDRYVTGRCAQCLWWRQRPAPGVYYESEDWPFIGDWTEERFRGHRTVAKQSAVVEQERARTPVLDATGVPWFRRQRCRIKRGGCGRRGMVLIRYWRPRYVTRRCIFCLRWSHKFSEGGAG